MNVTKSQKEEAKRKGRTWLFCLTPSVQIAAFIALALAAPRVTHATVFNVSTVSGLISAINTANGNGQADTINLAGGTYDLSSVNNNTNGPNGLPSVTTKITINGASLNSAGAITTTIRRFGGVAFPGGSLPNFRIFHVAATGNLTLDRLIIRGGAVGDLNVGGVGAGIRIEGNGVLSLTNSAVMDNRAISASRASDSGGGIAADSGSTVLLNNSIINANMAANAGGGILSQGSLMTIIDSTINGNSASSGGGISNFPDDNLNNGSLTISNSTISGNSSGFNGGGIENYAELSVINATITDNTNGNPEDNDDGGNDGGGGIHNAASATATVNLKNTLLAGNRDLSPGVDKAPDCDGMLASEGYNLVGNNQGCNFINATGDKVGASHTPIDPKLGALTDNSESNGGTRTHDLLAGSPAIDAVPNSRCRPTDQRDRVRPADGNGNGIATCDIGAVERSAVPACGTRLVLDNGVFKLVPIPATIFGTAENNVLAGTSGADVIHGLGGNDTISGLNGNDRICGGPGNDVMNGNAGNDSVSGNDGDDTLNGGSGNDSLDGGLGNDALYGGSGNDSLLGGRDDDALNGGADTDKCDGGPQVTGDTATNCETVTNVP